MKVVNPRTFLEIKVGQHQCVEIILHIRRSDILWFNDSDEDSRFEELLQLLESKVLPRMFQDELEKTTAELNKEELPPPLGPGGVPIAEKNEIAKKRKRFNRKEAALELQRREEEEKKQEKKEKDIHYAFGENIRLTYRLQTINQNVKEPRTDTLVFSDDKAESKLTPLHKLSKRLLVWCYPRVPGSDPTAPDPPGGGFIRSEFIPTADLFRFSS